MGLSNTTYPLIHPYGKIEISFVPLKFNRGEGIYLYDENGRRYLNAISGLWNLSLRLSNERIENAIINQLRMIS